MAKIVKVRYIIALISFVGFILNHSIKNVTNVTLVAMSGDTDPVIDMLLDNQTVSSSPSNASSSGFHWKKVDQNHIQQFFFYGYLILQIPSGRIGEIIGTRKVFGPAILIGSCLSFMFPTFARLGVGYAETIRFLQGLCLGVTFPTMHSLLAKWAPINERSMLIGFTFSGAPFGIVIVEVLSGFLSESELLGGWPAVYYMIGTFGCVWSVFWYFFVYDSPEAHPWIEEDEIKEINKGRNKQPTTKRPSLPIVQILTTIPVYAVIMAHTTYAWVNYTTSLAQPNYMKDIFNLNIKENGIVSALPHLAHMIFSWFYGFLCDKLRASGRLSITVLRKIFSSIGSFGPPVCFAILPQLGQNQLATKLVFVICMALAGSNVPGSSVLHADMAPTFAGSLMGLTNVCSNIPGFLVPLMTNVFVGNEKNLESWSKLFYLTAGVSTFGGLFFIIFASAKLQPWDPESEQYRMNNYGSNERQAHPRDEDKTKETPS